MPRIATPVFRDYAAEFMRDFAPTQFSPGHIANYNTVLRRWILPEFGDFRLSSITPGMVKRWTNRLATQTGAVNRAHIYHSFQRLMKEAHETFEYLPEEWTLQVRRVGGDKAKPRPTFSLDQATKVIELLPDYMREPSRVAIGSALRIGELCGLNRGDWSVEDRGLNVVRQYSLGKLTDPKKGSSGLVFPILDTPGILDSAEAQKPRWGRDEDALFRGPRGARLHPVALRDEWGKARRLVGLTEFHFHDLRSVGLTIYARIPGATVADIMAHGRHKDINSALRYQRVSDDDRRRSLSAVRPI